MTTNTIGPLPISFFDAIRVLLKAIIAELAEIGTNNFSISIDDYDVSIAKHQRDKI